MTMRFTALLTAMVLGTVSLAGCSGSGEASNPAPPAPGAVVVDLFYLDHPPVRPVIDEVDQVLARYDDKLDVRRHDSESAEGQRLAEELGLTEHLPVAIAIDRSVQVEVGGQTVRFEGFPVGRSPLDSAQGAWKLDDLDAALAQRTK